MSVTVEIPMALPSVSNLSEHWAAKAKRVKRQRGATRLALVSAYNRSIANDATRGDFMLELPLIVTLTRVAPRKLDDDNLRGAFKATRDAVAEFFHVDDADPRIEWRYAQAKGKAAVRISFEVRT